MTADVRVVLPPQLRALAQVGREVTVTVEGVPTQRALFDALEAAYPMLRGTLRDAGGDRRRPLLRFFACEEDHSDDDPDAPLPAAVAEGREPFLVIGAMAGG